MAELVSVTLRNEEDLLLPRMRLKVLNGKMPEAIVIRTYQTNV
jgi:hypothetical protein